MSKLVNAKLLNSNTLFFLLAMCCPFLLSWYGAYKFASSRLLDFLMSAMLIVVMAFVDGLVFFYVFDLALWLVVLAACVLDGAAFLVVAGKFCHYRVRGRRVVCGFDVGTYNKVCLDTRLPLAGFTGLVQGAEDHSTCPARLGVPAGKHCLCHLHTLPGHDATTEVWHVVLPCGHKIDVNVDVFMAVLTQCCKSKSPLKTMT